MNHATLKTIPKFTESLLKIVHYSDVQQIVLWLPERGTLYENILIIKTSNGQILLESTILDILNGSVQIIVDSLEFPPGEFTISIFRDNQKVYELFFNKVEEKKVIKPNQNLGLTSHMIDNTIREEVIESSIEALDSSELDAKNKRDEFYKDLQDKLISKIQFFSTGRDGYIVFSEEGKSCRFELEMNTGPAKYYLYIPSSARWEATTGFPLHQRDRILEHVIFMFRRDVTGYQPKKGSESEVIEF